MRPYPDKLAIIVAVDQRGGFAKDFKIPWNFPEDFKHFQKTTKGHVCVMGRHTYEEILERRKARDQEKNITSPIDQILPDRESYVVTTSTMEMPGATKVEGLRIVGDNLKDDDRTIFVLGGRRLFVEALAHTQTVYMTIIKQQYNCDMFFPVDYIDKNFKIIDGSQNDDMYFIKYERIH